jgi:acetyl-CoA acetyltransferase
VTTAAVGRTAAAAAVIGVGQTEYSRASHRTEWELANEAIASALDDAGVDPRDVDGLVRSSYEQVDEAMFLRTFRGRLTYYSQTAYGGLGLPAMVGHALGAVASGQARIVVAFRALNGYSQTRFGRAERTLGTSDATIVARGDRSPSGAFAAPYGVLAPGHLMAMWVRRYEHLFGVAEDDVIEAFCRIALDQRAYANRNPRAVMRDRPLDRAGYYAGRPINDPFRVFDFALETDGAAAVVIAGPDVARASLQPPVWIRAVVQGLLPYAESIATYGPLRNSEPYLALSAELYRRAGLGPNDISVAMLYDATVMTVLLAYEAYGFAPPGQGWRAIAEHGVGLDSPLPVNTHGGHLSEAYVHFMNSIVEAVRQCRGTATSQVPSVDAVLACSGPTGIVFTP